VKIAISAASTEAERRAGISSDHSLSVDGAGDALSAEEPRSSLPDEGANYILTGCSCRRRHREVGVPRTTTGNALQHAPATFARLLV
jgi:hypothetical protein